MSWYVFIWQLAFLTWLGGRFTDLWLFLPLLTFVHWCVLLAYMSEGARSPLKLELKTVMSCHLGAVSWTRFLWKSSLHSTPSPHTFKQPIFTWFFSFTLSADWCLLFVVPLMKYTFPCSLPLKTGFSVAYYFIPHQSMIPESPWCGHVTCQRLKAFIL